MPGWLDNLVFSLEYRFRYTGDLDDITNALAILSKAINLTSNGRTDMARRLSKRGILLREKFQHTGNSTDISDAIEDQEKAISLMPDSDRRMHELFGNLGSSYLCRFDETGNLEDISEAITALKQAVQLIQEDDPDSAVNWTNFGNALIRRFECTGDPSDISEAIGAQKKAVALTPDGHDDIPFLLNNLGLSFQTRFDVTGNLMDVSEAIAAHQKSIHGTPEGHAGMFAHLNNLGISFQCRSQRTGDITDISEAIDAHRKSVRLCPEGHPFMATLLSNLGNSLYGRFKSTNDITDISDAVLSHQEAVHLTSEEHPAMAGRLDNLGTSLKNRFALSESIEDIDTAISVAERAAKLTPEDDPSLPSRLNNLGAAFHTRFEHTKNPMDIFEAIVREERAIHLTPGNHASLPGLLTNLGLFLEDRFELTGDPTDISVAVATYKLAASLITGMPLDRLTAARKWATASKLTEDRLECLDAYNTAIDLVSQVAGMEYTIGLRHRILVDIPDLSNAAAATAFSLGKPKKALEWLEQGRCLVWTQLNNLRTPLEDLASFDSDLANELSRISQGLENAGLRNELVAIGTDADIMIEKMALQDEAIAGAKLAQEWDQLLQKIRDIPKFKNFLRSARYHDLTARLPKAGPVVVINVHEDRCDAIALVTGTDDPLHIHLDQFSYRDAVRLLHLLRSHLSAHGGRMDEESDEIEPVNELRYFVPFSRSGDTMQTVLRELWLGVVKPIIDALNIVATGLYSEGHTDCIFDYVISSYIPTVSCLMERTKVAHTTGQTDKVLVIGQPNAPGLPPLPGTKKELKAIQEKFDSANIPFLSLEGHPATIARTMEELERHGCIHFACHGVQDASHPLKSGFHLSDGRLDLWKILQVQNPVADFAFLSACQTSKGEEGLSEEVIHLAAGLLAGGYRGVVATMWSILDRHGMKVADEFYADLIRRRSRMREGRTDLVGSVGAAHALHYAIQRLREELGHSSSALLAWVPYIHMGV
ncbi:hypothetical protein GALMADRAFT_74871 [Galerina marginata CBS 339.88]|uniref:CHAT domain-containing protein n=1 Tax=Galerina marginata (strain CBS 339.88) TaxID=685588 RepID=A0A067SKK9_GALM3|nr:hypothetical protein GALMADRAFT_74871 [Galerina marginata CBS 339.88]